MNKEVPGVPKGGGIIEIDISSLPTLPRDATDRNRTSPFAFTGNKFEFRAVGSSHSCAGMNIALNTAMAEALDEICTKLEDDLVAGKDFNESLQAILQNIVKKHKRILFSGDNYSKEWHKEAENRGLPNLRTTPEALKAIIDDKTTPLFEKYKVLSGIELHSRYEVFLEAYNKAVIIEGNCAVSIAKTMIAPTAISYQRELASTIKTVESVSNQESTASKELLKEINSETEKLLKDIKHLEGCIEDDNSEKIIASMDELRKAADNLEGLLPSNLWPLPSYAEMMFMM